MSKLRLTLKSIACSDPTGDVHSMVDVTLNGTKVQENLQLGASTTTHTWDGTVNVGSDNTVVIAIVNAVGHDANEDGDFLDGGETTSAVITAFDYSTDDVNYTSLLPQSVENHTIPSGANSGTEIEIRPAVSEITVNKESATYKFNTTDGLVNSDDLTAKWVTVNGDGTYTDWEGNPLAN